MAHDSAHVAAQLWINTFSVFRNRIISLFPFLKSVTVEFLSCHWQKCDMFMKNLKVMRCAPCSGLLLKVDSVTWHIFTLDSATWYISAPPYYFIKFNFRSFWTTIKQMKHHKCFSDDKFQCCIPPSPKSQMIHDFISNDVMNDSWDLLIV